MDAVQNKTTFTERKNIIYIFLQKLKRTLVIYYTSRSKTRHFYPKTVPLKSLTKLYFLIRRASRTRPYPYGLESVNEHIENLLSNISIYQYTGKRKRNRASNVIKNEN